MAATRGDSIYNTLIKFPGTVSVTVLGEKFSAGHDDGVTLVIGGTTLIDFDHCTSNLAVLPIPALAATSRSSWCTGSARWLPGALVVNLPFVSPVPEPASLAVFGAGLLGLGFLRRRNPGCIAQGRL